MGSRAPRKEDRRHVGQRKGQGSGGCGFWGSAAAASPPTLDSSRTQPAAPEPSLLPRSGLQQNLRGRGASVWVCTPLSAPLWIPSPSVPLPEPSSKPLSPKSRVRKTFRPVFIQPPSQRRQPFSRLIPFGGDTCDVRGLTTLQAA